MAVYTQLEMAELAAALAPLHLGRLIAAQGVAAGIENTTYFLTLAVPDCGDTTSEFVLTIAETISATELQFIAQVMTHLGQHGIPVPIAITLTAEESVLSIGGKPALLVPKATGMHPEAPTAAQCHAIGVALGRCHQVMRHADLSQPSHRSLEWVGRIGAELLTMLAPTDRSLLTDELQRLDQFVTTYHQLPRAVIHGDLFRDNALFVDGRLTAIIDFFSAGDGYLMFDLAVAANDWCLRPTATDPLPCLQALAAGYRSIRAPTTLELTLWPHFLAMAALRFWVSRLADRLLPSNRSPQHRADKDPNEYRDLLLQHRHTPIDWPFLS